MNGRLVLPASLILVCLLLGAVTRAEEKVNDYHMPDKVSVRPIFFVPQDQPLPTNEQTEKVLKHLAWCQRRYKELLGKGNTFSIFPGEPALYQGKHKLEHYKKLPEKGAPQYTAELLAHFKHNRFNAPWIFLTIIINPKDPFPAGAGRPFNGGINTGGGIIIFSSYTLDHGPGFQSTLQHEAGHSFGLPHVDVYGLDMKTNPSMMSYNLKHHTKGFKEGIEPGIFIPEDLRALALNKRVFPKIGKFKDTWPLPEGYKIAKDIIWLGPMDIPGQAPYRIEVTTPSGEAFASKVENAVFGRIDPSAGPGVTYNQRTMWHSDVREPDTPEADAGPVDLDELELPEMDMGEAAWVSLNLTFPFKVTIDKIVVHSQHSGKYHAAKGILVEAKKGDKYTPLAHRSLSSATQSVGFASTQAKEWRLSFERDTTGAVVIRGLQFYNNDKEIFPPLIPFSR